MTRLIALLLLTSSACAAEQPDLNMDDLRKFSRRFCIKTDLCARPLHPNIEDRRENDTSLEVPHATDMKRLPTFVPGTVGSGPTALRFDANGRFIPNPMYNYRKVASPPW